MADSSPKFSKIFPQNLSEKLSKKLLEQFLNQFSNQSTKQFLKQNNWLFVRAIMAIPATYSAFQILFYDQQFMLVALLCIAGGGGWYGLQKLKSGPTQSSVLSARQNLQLELQKVQQLIVKLDHLGQRQLFLEKANQIALNLKQNPEPNQLQIVMVGETGVGKTSIIKALIGDQNPTTTSSFLTLPAFSGFLNPKRKIQLLEAKLAQFQIAYLANLVVMVVTADLTETENQLLKNLKANHKPLILAFNQIDRYLPSDRDLILEKLQTYAPDPVAIAANPKPITVRQYAPSSDGKNSCEEVLQVWEENQSPQIEPLKQRLEQVLSRQWENLFYQNLQSQVRSLRQETEIKINQFRRAKAEPIIQRYQWLNAGAMFVSPMPALDLFASSAINGQLLIELGKLYDRNLNWEQAKEIGAMIGKNLWQLGCIELATAAIATGLKSHTLTYAIGGTTQAVCAAYITKVGAISFLDYLELDPELTPELNNFAPDLENAPKNEFIGQTKPIPKLNTLRLLCEKNLQKTQGISIFTDLISSFKKLNPIGLHP
jgi:uncharacterized protein